MREPRVYACALDELYHEFPFAALRNCVTRFAVTKATSRSNWPQLARPRQRPEEIERVIKTKTVRAIAASMTDWLDDGYSVLRTD